MGGAEHEQDVGGLLGVQTRAQRAVAGECSGEGAEVGGGGAGALVGELAQVGSAPAASTMVMISRPARSSRAVP